MSQRNHSLHHIARVREAQDVPGLFPYLFGTDGVVADAAAGALEQLVSACGSTDLVRLDARVRAMGAWHWPDVSPSDVFRLSRGLTGVLGLISCHRNGYVREAAVRALAGTGRNGELPFLLIRLNDWVPQVRQIAREAVLDRLRPDHAQDWVRHLTLLLRLERLGREDHHELLERAIGLLRRPECRAALDDAISDADRETRRAAFRVLLSVRDTAESALDLGLRSEDPTIRLTAAREARARLEGDALADILDRLMHDRFMPLRREALYGYVERLPHVASLRLRRALFDPNASVREAARFFLAQSGEMDLAAVYRPRLTEIDDACLAIAIAGLGETGTVIDGPRVEPFLSHPAARVRKATVRALGRLDAERYLEQFLTALKDESPGVVKVAREIVRARLFLVAPERLWSIWVAAARPHVRRAVLSLIADFPWWDGAALLVAATGATDEELRSKALEYLRRGRRNCNRSAVRPTRQQFEHLAAARRQFGDCLDADTQADLDVHLAYAARQQA